MGTSKFIQPKNDALMTVKHKSKAVGSGGCRRVMHWFECSKCGRTLLKTSQPHYPIPVAPTCPGCGRRFVWLGRPDGTYALDERK